MLSERALQAIKAYEDAQKRRETIRNSHYERLREAMAWEDAAVARAYKDMIKAVEEEDDQER